MRFFNLGGPPGRALMKETRKIFLVTIGFNGEVACAVVAQVLPFCNVAQIVGKQRQSAYVLEVSTLVPQPVFKMTGQGVEIDVTDAHAMSLSTACADVAMNSNSEAFSITTS